MTDLMRALAESLTLNAIEERMEQAVRDLNTRVATCHQRVACPTCKHHIGDPCSRLNSRDMRALKHPHRARVEADGIPLR